MTLFGEGRADFLIFLWGSEGRADGRAMLGLDQNVDPWAVLMGVGPYAI